MSTLELLAVDSPTWRDRARRSDKLIIALTVLLGLLVLCALLAPWLVPYPPNGGNILAANLGPSGTHWLGTDQLGRDILSRLMVGARLSLLGPTIIVLCATVAAVTLAVSSVWIGGWFDQGVARVLDLMFAFPGLLLAILAVAMIGPGLLAPVLALALAYTPYIARVVRTIALRERHLAYVESCQVIGISGWRICVRHLVPNVVPIVLAQATIAFGSALVDLAAISYLGLGVQSPQAEWGLMVSDGQSALLNGSPWESLSACVMIIVVVLSVNVLGERIAQRTEAAA
jgi:peptide/nickel transport system permease protein